LATFIVASSSFDCPRQFGVACRHDNLDGIVELFAGVAQRRWRIVEGESAAKPGLLSALDLPLITGKGLVRPTTGPSPDSRLVGRFS
jgi:hypothetical protein